MSTTKILTGVFIVALLCGVIYQYRRTSELKIRIAEVQNENAQTSKRLLDLQRDLVAIRTQSASAERASTKVSTATVQAQSQARPAKSAPASAVPGVTPKAPKGWFKNGSANDLYEVGVDENNPWGGMPSAYAKSTGDANGKFGE